MSNTVQPRRRSLPEYVVRGVITGVLLGLAFHFAYVLAGGNVRTVLPGQVYRCAQLSPEKLERLIQKHGIRTVVNLRGCCPTAPWYLNEAELTARLDVAQEDVALSATRLPSKIGVQELADVIDRATYPILFHCHQGADRTGLASVMAVLLRTDATFDQARRHLGFSSGHLSVGKTGHVDRFFDLYQNWLAEHELTHSSDLFRLWIQKYYRGAESDAVFTLQDPFEQEEGHRPVLRCKVGESRLLTVRCHNRSWETWRFQPGNNAGMHVWWTLLNRDEQVVKTDRAGMFHATVEPGRHLDVAIPIPALPSGRYELRIDLANEQHAFFSQMGNDVLVVEVEVS